MPHTDLVPTERTVDRIYVIRGRKVMLDRDLAALYGIPTKTLKQAVKRNFSVSRPISCSNWIRKSSNIGGHNL